MSDPVSRLNTCSKAEFISALGTIYEHSPWVADKVFEQRPFDTLEQLARLMAAAVENASNERKITLLQAHPELAGREAEKGELTADSQTEQKRAGLDQCSAEELEKIQRYNRQYRNKFGFPFIIAVSGLDRQQVIDSMELRVNHDPEAEFATALAQVDRIAWIRLQAL